MKLTEPTTSIIIPTHNRVTSLLRLLEKLSLQTYPVHLMEVIVIANSCTDETVSTLQTYQASYKLRFAESFGDGPAVPRNLGASLATGELFIFLDDDVYPSDRLVESHVMANKYKKDLIVIGYLPLTTPLKSGFFKISLKTYWEEKFHRMQNPYYRYSYTDLLSGNFSIPSDLFKRSQGFITGLHCRDDYEFGIRLLQLGATFTFSKEAWGLHQDEVTDLHRSLKRKMEEGKTDVKLWYLHPDIIVGPLQKSKSKRKYEFIITRARTLLVTFLKLTDVIALFLKHTLFILERLRLRNKWMTLSIILHSYWYFRGVFEELNTKDNLIEYFNYIPKSESIYEDLKIDLREGIQAATQILDQINPGNIKLLYGADEIGFIPYTATSERIKGKHLRYILATCFAEPFAASLAYDELTNMQINTDQILKNNLKEQHIL